MTKKDQLKEYETNKVDQKVVDFFDAEYIVYGRGQSKWGSFFEAHLNAIGGAPPAILANYILLEHFYPVNATTEYVAYWAIITWPIFFYLSVGRTFIFRRIFEKYKVNLDPVIILKRIWRKT
jgi:hypothetical protein